MSEIPAFSAASFVPNCEGIWLGLPERVYRAAPGVNVSSLKPLAESALKYRYAQDHPQEQTAAMSFGTIVHALTLEPDVAHEAFVMRPKQWDSFRTKEAREWRDAQSLIILSDSDLAEMTAAANALKAEPNSAWILERAEKEVAVFKRHERTGLLLKARLDLPFMDRDDSMAVADIKKVQSVNKARFMKDIGTRLYHMAGAFYLDIFGASSFYFIAIEEAAPNEIAIYRLSDKSAKDGRKLYEDLLTKLVECQGLNEWPSRFEQATSIEDIDAPEWMLQQLEQTA